MGAVFRLPYAVTKSIEDFINDNPRLKAYAAVVSGDALKLNDIVFNDLSCVVIGNEANGLKDATIAACDSAFTIPMKGKAESLNASIAAGIIMWEMIK